VTVRISPSFPALAAGGVAVAVLVPSALDRPFWQDEVASARVISEPSLARTLHLIAQRESTPPGWYLLAWLGHQAGLSFVALRFLSVGFVAGLVALAVVAASRLLPRLVALAVGLVLALSGQLAFHGTELRAYALLALLSLVFALALEAAALDPSLRRLALLGACVAAGSIVHYFFIFTVAGGLAWISTERSLRGSRGRLAVAVGGGLAALGPWLPALGEQVANGRYAWIGPFKPLKVADSYAVLFGPPSSLYARGVSGEGSALVLGLRLSVLALVLTGFLLLWRRSPQGRLWALLGLAPVGLAALLWLTGWRIFDARNLVGVTPFAAAAAMAALGALPRRSSRVALGCALALTAAAFAIAPPTTPPFDRLARTLARDGWDRGDPLLLLPDGPALRSPLAWYLKAGSVLLARPAGPDYVVAERSYWHRLRRLIPGRSRQQRVGPFVVVTVRSSRT
jgi:hypothetical protein